MNFQAQNVPQVDQEQLQKLDLKSWDLETIIDSLIDFGIKFLVALLIISIGFWVANRITRLLTRPLSRTDMTVAMQKFLKSMLNVVLKTLVILVAMSTVGFQITALVAVLGGMAIGLGMALQGSLANFAGGLLIIFFKPFQLGDYIESVDGKNGTVEDISVLQTTLLTPDMRTVVLPNGSVFNNPITNYSTYGIRRVDINIGISYDADFEKAHEVLLNVFKKEPLMLDDKGYVAEIDEFGESSVKLAVYGYTKTEDYLQAKWNLNKAVQKALNDNDIKIPYLQADIHIVSKPKNLSIQ